MHVKREEKQAMSLQVTEGLTVTILPDLNHEFLMSSKEAASGYGTSSYVIRTTQMRHSEELVEGKHFVKGVTFCHTHVSKGVQIQPHQIFWTKRGIVRLGFFIKSERAKLFRDWAEELVIDAVAGRDTQLHVSTKELPARRTRANRLTSERLLSIMADVTRIDDRELRLSIANKLMQGGIS